VLLLSHVLEHLVDPVSVLRQLLNLVVPGGLVVVAVPNVLEWRTRISFLRGRFEYSNEGVLDRTHLRFYTYRTARRELVDPIEELKVLGVSARGSFPLGILRRHLINDAIRERIDGAATRHWPNLFASEIGIVAQKVDLLNGSIDRAAIGD